MDYSFTLDLFGIEDIEFLGILFPPVLLIAVGVFLLVAVIFLLVFIFSGKPVEEEPAVSNRKASSEPSKAIGETLYESAPVRAQIPPIPMTIPEAPAAPAVPEVPVIPAAPEIPAAPVIPAVPEIVPEPSIPEAVDVPEPVIPEVPVIAEAEEVSEEMPEIIPEPPVIPEAPEEVISVESTADIPMKEVPSATDEIPEPMAESKTEVLTDDDYAPSQGHFIVLRDNTDPSKVYKAYITNSIIIGKREGDIIIDDSSVSGKHCEIKVIGNEHSVTDLGSTNGTKVNGVKIDAPVYLEEGNLLEIGRQHFTVSFE